MVLSKLFEHRGVFPHPSPWRVAKEMCGRKANPCQGIPPLVHLSADLVCDDSQKADLLNETFINLNTSLNQSAFSLLGRATRKVRSLLTDEVRKASRSLPSKNSKGPDKNFYPLLKEAGQIVVGPLTTLINRRTQELPD